MYLFEPSLEAGVIKNETVEQTLRRETEEEIGVSDLNISDFLGEVPGAKEGDIVYVFIGEIKQEPRLMEPEKFSEWKWIDIHEIPNNFINLGVLNLVKDHANNKRQN